MSFQFICPAKLETSLTGFLGGIEKTYRGRLFRVEFRGGNDQVVCTKDGKPVSWQSLPHPIRKAAHEGATMIRQANEAAGRL